MRCLTAAVFAAEAIPSTSTGTFTACVLKTSGATRIIDYQAGKRCKATENTVAWAQTGPQGPVGATGPIGPAGPPATIATVTFGYQTCPIAQAGSCPATVEVASSTPGLTVDRVVAPSGSIYLCVSNVPDSAISYLSSSASRLQTNDVAVRATETTYVSDLHPGSAALAAVNCPTSTDIFVWTNGDVAQQQGQHSWTLWFS